MGELIILGFFGLALPLELSACPPRCREVSAGYRSCPARLPRACNANNSA